MWTLLNLSRLTYRGINARHVASEGRWSNRGRANMENITYPLRNKRQRLAWEKQRDQEINESLSHPDPSRAKWRDVLVESRAPYCPDCPLRKEGIKCPITPRRSIAATARK